MSRFFRNTEDRFCHDEAQLWDSASDVWYLSHTPLNTQAGVYSGSRGLIFCLGLSPWPRRGNHAPTYFKGSLGVV